MFIKTFSNGMGTLYYALVQVEVILDIKVVCPNFSLKSLYTTQL